MGCEPFWASVAAVAGEGGPRPDPHCSPLFIPTIGSLNLLVRSRNKGALDTHAWSLSGNKGNVWQQAHVPINPSGPFQVRLSQPSGRWSGQGTLRKTRVSSQELGRNLGGMGASSGLRGRG